MRRMKTSELALGCMGMSDFYGPADEGESIRTIQAAIERGITLLDTGDFYGMGDNELLIGRAITGRRDKVRVSVKFGALRGPDGSWQGIDARPVAVKTFAAYSLRRLGVDVIDVYRPGRLDPNVPIEDTIGAIADLIKAGYVRQAGLSEVGIDTIRRAHAVSPIADLQIEYSLASRGPEDKIFPVLTELGIGATLYGILSRGLLSGSRPAVPADFRTHLPRFAGDEGKKNALVVERLRAFAEAVGRSPAQLAFGWVVAKQPRLTPLVGARTTKQLLDTLGALDKPLTVAEIADVEAIVSSGAIGGPRYHAAQMAQLDSER